MAYIICFTLIKIQQQEFENQTDKDVLDMDEGTWVAGEEK